MTIVVELLALFLFLYIAVNYMILDWRIYLKQRSCKHDQGVNETRSCQAICKACGKDLGFIGTEENKVRRSQ